MEGRPKTKMGIIEKKFFYKKFSYNMNINLKEKDKDNEKSPNRTHIITHINVYNLILISNQDDGKDRRDSKRYRDHQNPIHVVTN